MFSLLPPYVKVCCISSIEEAQLAMSAGASALGMIASSPGGLGMIDEQVIAEIVAVVPPPIATFLQTSLQDADAIAKLHAICRTTAIELVASVSSLELRKLRKSLPGVKLVQVVHAFREQSLDDVQLVASPVDALLLNCDNPSLSVKEPSDCSRTHDWQLGRLIRQQVNLPIFLAGRLDARNVSEAIATVRPFGLEVCSGVRINGALSPAKLDAFMYAVHQAGG